MRMAALTSEAQGWHPVWEMAVSSDPVEHDLEERLGLAREVFARRYALCFWSWPRDIEITPELLPNVAHALREYGGRAEVILSEAICPSTLYKERYLPRYARDVTPTAT